MTHYQRSAGIAVTAGALLLGACNEETTAPSLAHAAAFAAVGTGTGSFDFEPIGASAVCVAGGTGHRFDIPAGLTQTIIARESDIASLVAGTGEDLWDMNTLNETGPHAGRYIYRTHETGTNGAVTRTDLQTGETILISQNIGYRRLDGIAWTPWHTLIFAEETTGGRIFEYNPTTGTVDARTAPGLRSHEGMRVDAQGNLFGIAETAPGYVFKFVPDRRGDLTSGTNYALKVADASKTGAAEWVELDMAAAGNNANVAAATAGATGWSRPEDVELAGSTGNNRGGANVLYVVVTGESLVLEIELEGDEAFVSNFVRNVPGFSDPDNLALSPSGTLFITEDPSSNPVGADIWAAATGGDSSSEVVRFASLRDCGAEPSGIYFDTNGQTLFVNVQHASWESGSDLLVAISRD